MKVLKYIIALVILLSGVGFYLSKKLPVNIPIKVLSTDYKGDLPLERLQLPDGFEIGVFADDVENARSMTLSPREQSTGQQRINENCLKFDQYSFK